MEDFNYRDYKNYIINFINNKEKPRGEFTRLANFLGVSTVLISQIFKGEKDLSLEQGLKLTKYFGFNELQTNYFLSCLSFNKAGDHSLKSFFEEQLNEIRARSQKISERVSSHKVLTEAQKAIYYSDWHYSAVHLACALPFLNEEKDLSTHLNINLKKTDRIIKFLIETGLVRKEYGALQIGTTYIHLDQGSPFITQHHRNWRLLSSLKASDKKEGEVLYTAPMVISKKLATEINGKLLSFIQEMVKSTEGCPDEELWNLNIDFLRIGT